MSCDKQVPPVWLAGSIQHYIFVLEDLELF